MLCYYGYVIKLIFKTLSNVVNRLMSIMSVKREAIRRCWTYLMRRIKISMKLKRNQLQLGLCQSEQGQNLFRQVD